MKIRSIEEKERLFNIMVGIAMTSRLGREDQKDVINFLRELEAQENRIHYPKGSGNEIADKLNEIESALGFELYTWQTTYIVDGHFRRYGATTAKILSQLLDSKKIHLDYRCVRTPKEKFYFDEMRNIHRRLINAGIEVAELEVKT